MRWNHDSPRSTGLAVGHRAGGGGDPLGPARGVLLFLFGEPQQDVLRRLGRARGRRGGGRWWRPRLRAATSSRRWRGSSLSHRPSTAQSDQPLEQHDRADAGGDQHDLAQRVAVDLAAMQVGNQIGHRDVEQAGRREAPARTAGCSAGRCTAAYATQRAGDAGGAGDDVQHQRAAAAVAGGEQDGDVADFLRNLVRGDGDGGVDAERHRGQHRGADDRAVDEVVKGVADEARAARWRRAPGTRRCGSGAAAPASRARRTAGCRRAACRRPAAAASVSSASGSSASSATPSSAPTA